MMISKNTKEFIKGSTIGIAVFSLLGITVLGLIYLNGVWELKKREEDFQNRVAGFVNPFYVNENKILAKGAFVVDDVTGTVLYAKNENKEMPIASLTKIMSTLVAGQYLEQENIDTVQIGSVEVLAPVDFNFVSGEEWATEDLLTAMLVSSSNVAAESLFNVISQNQVGVDPNTEPITLVEMMNEIARSFGLEKTRFLNSTGLDVKDESVDGGISFGGVSSPVEVVFLVKMLEAVFPDLASQTSLEEVTLYSKDGIAHQFVNTDELISQIPISFSKTGYTDGSGGSLVIKTNTEGRDVYMVVLGSTKEGRFEDIRKLYNSTSALFSDLDMRGLNLLELKDHNLIGYGY